MSDERNSVPDLSRIVGLIMENPKLIEEISSLARAKDTADEQTNAAEEPDSHSPDKASEETKIPQDGKERRARLLSAIKPYVSEQRARAIDSMISISEILEVMKAR